MEARLWESKFVRLCRFDDDRRGRDRIGVVLDDAVADVSEILDALPAARYPYPPGDALIAALPDLRPEIERLAAAATPAPLSSLRLKAPVANPGKIVAAPINYQSHIDLDLVGSDIAHAHIISHISKAGLFLKAASSLVGPAEGVTIAFPDRRNDHEIELVAVIGRTARNVPRERALEHVAGYCIGLDMTVRGTEDRSFRKSADSYSVAGPWLVTADEIGDPGALEMRLAVNGRQRQKANTRSLVYDLPKLIEYASSVYTLYPGDLLFTGTPDGVGPVKAGDVIECAIERIGSMSVAVR
ncbi:MAG: fumarylacetoacetate hydrolase family protein [Azospirillaceae bacterium]